MNGTYGRRATRISTLTLSPSLTPSSSNEQQEEAIKLLEHLQFIHTTAKEAVALGDGTLKEANNTYHILAGFQNQVQQSSESAKLALATVPGIEQQIQDAQKTVEEAESVSTVDVRRNGLNESLALGFSWRSFKCRRGS